MIKHLFHRKILLLLLTTLFASGCATVKYVKEQLGIMDEKIAQESEARQQQVDAINTRLDAMEGKFSRKFANRNMYDVRETRAVYFDFNKAELKDAAITTLVEVGRILKEDPNTLVELEGHTDAVGPTLYNLHLSRERAAAVVRHLVHNFGIGTRRISWVGFGKEAPVADNNSEEGRAKNRRVTMRVLTPKVGAESVAQSK